MFAAPISAAPAATIDAVNWMTGGSLIQVKPVHENETFEAEARVAYVSYGLGICVSFESIPAEQLATLDRWLESARKNGASRG